MHINNNISNTSFKSSRVNIASIADSHGDILSMPQLIKTIQANYDDIFEKKDEKSTNNILSIAGDYFMNPSKKGVLTNPNNTYGDVQYMFLIKLIHDIKRNLLYRNNFDTIYTPGNHCFGGGDEWLFNKLYFAPLRTIITNVDLKKSPLLARLMLKTNTIKTEKIVEIQDDKNPDLKNHVLLLGVTIPSTYYNLASNIKHTKFIDQTKKNEPSIEKQDLQETIDILSEKIDKFKKQYPTGAVVLLSHMGNKISNILANNIEGINLILNGHDHKDYVSVVNGTQILSHGQNNQFLFGINMKFDDNGKLACIKAQKYQTIPFAKIARQDESLQKFVTKYLKTDLEPLLYIGKFLTRQDELLYSNSIRYQNTLLMNYITTAVKTAAKQIYPNLDVIGIPSTIIRSGIKSNPNRTTFNNVDLFNMFKGADENVSALEIGTITGKELIKLIAENVRNNLKSPTRNALIQWSDIQINRSLFVQNAAKKEKTDYFEAIKIRNSKTGKFERIDANKKYTVLLSDKYLIKKSKHIMMPSAIKDKFHKIDESYDTLFKTYLDMQNKKLKILPRVKEQRII